MKKILHLVNNDKDGIFHFVSKLVNTSLKEHENKILVKYSNSSSKNIIKIDSGKSLTDFFYNPKFIVKYFKEFYYKIKNKFKRDFCNFFFKPDVLFNFYFNEIDFLKFKDIVKEINVIIIYTFKEVLSPKDLTKIKKHFKCKIIFYPLDYELLSGGYHFDNYEKENYQLIKKNDKLIEYKKKYISNLNIYWIAVNNYVEKKIKLSKIFNIDCHKVYKIYNTLESFKFSDREILDFKIEKDLNKFDIIILFSSLKLSDRRKGLHELKSCLKYYDNLAVKNSKIGLITLGNENNTIFKTKKIEHIHINYIENFKQLNLLFKSCNIFLNLSKSDFGPVLCEIAFRNDLYILSSNTGIAPEIVMNNLNGFIYNNKNEMNIKFAKLIDLCSKNYKPDYNSQTLEMKNIYETKKDLQFNELFNE